MTGSVDCSANDLDESVEHLNTYYQKSRNTYQRNKALLQNTASWEETQKEEM